MSTAVKLYYSNTADASIDYYLQATSAIDHVTQDSVHFASLDPSFSMTMTGEFVPFGAKEVSSGRSRR